MTEFGMIAKKLNLTRDLSEQFDDSLILIKKSKLSKIKYIVSQEAIEKIHLLFERIFKFNNNELTDKIVLKKKLQSRYSSRWINLENQINELEKKLKTKKIENISLGDIELLEDIADILTEECTKLFHKIRGLSFE